MYKDTNCILPACNCGWESLLPAMGVGRDQTLHCKLNGVGPTTSVNLATENIYFFNSTNGVLRLLTSFCI